MMPGSRTISTNDTIADCRCTIPNSIESANPCTNCGQKKPQ